MLAWVSGTSLELLSEPLQPLKEVLYRLDRFEEQHLDDMVQKLIDQHIVVQCTEPKFLAGLFSRLKPEGKFRLIIDLSPLNERIQYNHFKMESLLDALDLLEEKAYITKVDLKNAYYSTVFR